jgi:hypothetical protein
VKTIDKVILSLFVALITLCAPGGLDLSDNTKGGGTETTNSLVIVQNGMQLYGTAPIGSRVFLYSEIFNPLEINSFYDSVMVDSSGTYNFYTLRDTGNYNFILKHDSISLGAFVPSLHVMPYTSDSLMVILDSLGMISGTIMYTTNVQGPVFVYLKGSNFFSQADSTGYYHIEEIPFGVYTAKLTYLSKPVTNNNNDQKLAILSSKQTTASVNFTIK